MIATAENTTTWKRSEKQADFMASRARENLYSGAFGAGKTRGGLLAFMQHAQIPGNVVGLFRKTLAALKPTTLHTLLYEEVPGPVLPRGSYTHNKADCTIRLHGGGTILYCGCDNHERIGSMNLGAAFIDEATELDELEYNMVLGRLRNPADPNQQLYLGTNPSGQSHFLYRKFFEEFPKNKKGEPVRFVIMATPADNPFLPENYLDLLDSFTGQYKERYVEGKWVTFEGLIYDLWDRKKFVAERHEEWREVIAGVDYGITNPFAILVIGIDGDGRMHAFKEVYERGLRIGDQVKLAEEMGADIYVVDPSAKALIMEMQAAGLYVIGGDNAVQDGIGRVRNRLSFDVSGEPRFTVEPSLVHFLREVESYHRKKDSEDPVKQGDHLMDDWRYVTMYIDGGVTPSITTLGSMRREEEGEEEYDRMRDERLWVRV